MTLGHSITNGANSQANANHRWPDLLAARLHTGVANVGIAGNRLLSAPPASTTR